MRAAYYEQNGSARDVLRIGRGRPPRPPVGARFASSSRRRASILTDVKARSGGTRKIAYPRVIPDSDGCRRH